MGIFSNNKTSLSIFKKLKKLKKPSTAAVPLFIPNFFFFFFFFSGNCILYLVCSDGMKKKKENKKQIPAMSEKIRVCECFPSPSLTIV